MKTLIKILCLSVLWFSCEEPEPDVYGCTDDTACNFDSDANIDNNSCIYEHNACDMCSDNGDFSCFIGTWNVFSLIQDGEEAITEDFYNENGNYLFNFTSDESLIISLSDNNEFVFPNFIWSIDNSETILTLYDADDGDVELALYYLFNGMEILSLNMIITSETDPVNQIISLERFSAD